MSSFKKMLLMPYEAIKNKRSIAQGYQRLDENDNSEPATLVFKKPFLKKQSKKRGCDSLDVMQSGRGQRRRRRQTRIGKKRRVTRKKRTNSNERQKININGERKWIGL